LSGVLSSIGVSVSENSLSESVIIDNSYFVILLVSHNVVNTLEFLEEDGDNLINNLNVISQSLNFLHVEVDHGLFLGLGLVYSIYGKFPGMLGFLFHFGGKNDIVLEFGGVGIISVKFDLEDMGFTFSTLDESNSVSTSSDLSLDEVGHRLLKMYNKLIKFHHESLKNSLTSCVSCADLSLKGKSSLFIVNEVITDFFSSSSSLRDVSTSDILGKRKEIVHGLLFEEMGISG
jgi:hypothetical protein